MTDKDFAPVSRIIIKRNHGADLWFERWEWRLFIEPTRHSEFRRYQADYRGNATTQRRALKKAMKLVPRYVQTEIS